MPFQNDLGGYGPVVTEEHKDLLVALVVTLLLVVIVVAMKRHMLW